MFSICNQKIKKYQQKKSDFRIRNWPQLDSVNKLKEKFLLGSSTFRVRKTTAKTTPTPTSKTKIAKIPLEGDNFLNSSDLSFSSFVQGNIDSIT